MKKLTPLLLVMLLVLFATISQAYVITPYETTWPLGYTESTGTFYLGYSTDYFSLSDHSLQLAPNTIQYATVEVSEAELEALNTTPHTLVAAPGAGKAIEFISAVIFYDHSTADYTTQGDLMVVTGTTGTTVSDTIAGSAMVLGSADAYRIVQALSADVQLDINEAIAITIGTADPTDPGTAAGKLTIKVTYRIHDFN